jgi:hypothetical protein
VLAVASTTLENPRTVNCMAFLSTTSPSKSLFQLASVAITLFSIFTWLLSTRANSSYCGNEVGPSHINFGSSRAPPRDASSLLPKAVMDEPADNPIWDTQNKTLGVRYFCVSCVNRMLTRYVVSQIYAIFMPHSSDKSDFLALMALVSDLNIEFVDGVNGSLIHPSAIPAVSRCKRTFRYNGSLTLRRFGTAMLPPECGDNSARISISISSQYSFLPIFAYLTECSIVQNRIHSALIIEDDSDWDILLKPQMLSFARSIQIL